MHRLFIFEEEDTEAGIAYLSEGRGAPAIVLIISWSSEAAATRGMDRIMSCGSWQIVGEDQTLMIIGQGGLVLLSGEEASAIFAASWEMGDAHEVSFFVQRARTYGYFLLLPAVNTMPGNGAPVPCYLG